MRLLPLAVALALAGCTSSSPGAPVTTSTSPGAATSGGPGCTASQSTLLGVHGIAGFNMTWDPARVRDQLDRAGYHLRGAEFGVDGQDPFGDNFSFVQGGEPRESYRVDYLNDSRPHDAAVEPAAKRQWADVAPRFNDSLLAFEGATGERHRSVGYQPIVVVADYVCT